MIRTYKGQKPRLGEGVYVDPVRASHWRRDTWRSRERLALHYRPGRLSIRSPSAPIPIFKTTQSVHVMAPDYPTVVGHHVTVGHSVILHGCTIGDYALIGIGRDHLEWSNASESESIIAAGTLVPERMQIPPGVMVMGSARPKVRQRP